MIALLLPALAIIQQVAIDYSETGHMVISGDGPKFRQTAAAIIAGSGLLSAFAAFTALNYLQLTLPIRLAVGAVVLAIAGFSMIPFNIYGNYRYQGNQVVDAMFELLEMYQHAIEFQEEAPEEIQSELWEHLGETFPEQIGTEFLENSEDGIDEVGKRGDSDSPLRY